MTLCQITFDWHEVERSDAHVRGKTKRLRDKRLGPKRKVGGRARKAELELLKSFSSLEVHTYLTVIPIE